ncbi:LLM class flavin-dependent oxidoreductase [Variovorax sp. Sphag1AA]|uniref:LLM class flavin-dependent oxidoreductase n=1 Tax=Variovorax sp. Sphag1AA TaxID=2587027 RepID=UPI00160B6D16|nr:LLM class flavin-dependent oxidoreductase [Variovorax sp. Sphag1AA]MBB3181446.1 alkanesulfonate monooxygenase [Variovorax sp. Sphag1AA]
MTTTRFGVWAPVYGAWGSYQHPDDPPDASYRRSRDLIVRAEALGFDSALLAQHIVSPSLTDGAILETWTAAAGIAEATRRIELIAAVKPLLFHPGVLAKMALGIHDISGGRFAINLVSAWFRPEMAHLGIEMPPHDSRYAYSAEWLDIVTRLWSGDTIDHAGERFSIERLRLAPGPREGRRPAIYLGGESEPARQLAAASADVFFINGRPLPETGALVNDLRRRPRKGKPLRFGLAAFVIARETASEARAEYERLQALADLDDRSAVVRGVDPEVAMFKVSADRKKVGTNGGTLAGLVGSYDEVAARIDAFAEAGIELFMLQFQPLEAELERFAAEVAPRVKSRASASTRFNSQDS